jgi:hypothetical protein
VTTVIFGFLKKNESAEESSEFVETEQVDNGCEWRCSDDMSRGCEEQNEFYIDGWETQKNASLLYIILMMT